MIDLFQYLSPSQSSAPSGGFDVTPDDNADLPYMTRAIMVTASGDVSVTYKDGSSHTLPGLLAGVQYTGQFRRIRATGTTATGIKGQY